MPLVHFKTHQEILPDTNQRANKERCYYISNCLSNKEILKYTEIQLREQFHLSQEGHSHL